MTHKKIIILAGSGHAHLEVIKDLTSTEIAQHQFILISPQRTTYYSGLIPRLISGEITASQLTIHSADFAQSKGFQYIQDSILSLDPENNTVHLVSGKKIAYDILSLNTGGVVKKIPTQSPAQTIYLRPFELFMDQWSRIEKNCSEIQNPRFAVIGGGAAAVEVATTLKIRLNKNHNHNNEVHLITKGHRLCENYSEKISAAILNSMKKLNITVHFDEYIDQIYSNYILIKQSQKIEFDSVFIITPTEPSNIITKKSDTMLRLYPNVFAVGDAASMGEHPNLPRSGVNAIQQGRLLIQNIRATLGNNKLKKFSPSKKQLNILISGHQTARMIFGKFHIEGNLPFRVKKWIDDRYIKKFIFLLLTGVSQMTYSNQFKKPSAELLKKTLTPEQYTCTQESGTEAPFKNKYWDTKDDGIYVDIVSGEALFSSLDKYDSGSGWPSFHKPIEDDSLIQKIDKKLFSTRTEVRSKQADSHLGHVFDDGPSSTKKRYCINSASLKFIPLDEMKNSGYGKYISIFINKKKWDTAILAGGCFWGVQELFRQQKGVIYSEVGYIGGDHKKTKYEDVKTSQTGHAEAVRIIFDPQQTTYTDLLLYFFKIHDPTTLNQQGNDKGSQYRSEIFYKDTAQKAAAQKAIQRVDLSKKWIKPVVTQITLAPDFYRGEEHHQDYIKKHPNGYTCHFPRNFDF